MKLLSVARGWLRSMPVSMKIGVIAGSLVLIVSVVAVLIPVSSDGRNIFGAQSIISGSPGSSVGESGQPSSNPTRGPNASSNSGASRGSGDVSHGQEPCDEQNRAADAATKKACVAGYVPPTVALDSITCEPGEREGNFVIHVVWKMVGGKYREFRMSSSDRSGPLEEKWTIAEATADTVLFEQHSVSVRFLSMSSQPGTIDRVHSEVIPLKHAGDVCAFEGSQPTDQPTVAPTDSASSDG